MCCTSAMMFTVILGLCGMMNSVQGFPYSDASAPSESEKSDISVKCSQVPIGQINAEFRDTDENGGSAAGVVHVLFNGYSTCSMPMWIEVYYHDILVGRSSNAMSPINGAGITLPVYIQFSPVTTTELVVQAVGNNGVGSEVWLDFLDRSGFKSLALLDSETDAKSAESDVKCGDVPQGQINADFLDTDQREGMAAGVVNIRFRGYSTCSVVMWMEVYYNNVLVGRSANVMSPINGAGVTLPLYVQFSPVTTTTLVVQAMGTAGLGTSVSLNFLDIAVQPTPTPTPPPCPLVPQGLVNADFLDTDLNGGEAAGVVNIRFTGTTGCSLPMWMEVYYNNVLVGRSANVMSPINGATITLPVSISIAQVTTTTLLVQAMGTSGLGNLVSLTFLDISSGPSPSPSPSCDPVPQGQISADFLDTNLNAGQAGGVVNIRFTGLTGCAVPMWMEVYYNNILVGRSSNVMSPTNGATITLPVNIILNQLTTNQLVVESMGTSGLGSSVVVGFTDVTSI